MNDLRCNNLFMWAPPAIFPSLLQPLEQQFPTRVPPEVARAFLSTSPHLPTELQNTSLYVKEMGRGEAVLYSSRLEHGGYIAWSFSRPEAVLSDDYRTLEEHWISGRINEYLSISAALSDHHRKLLSLLEIQWAPTYFSVVFVCFFNSQNMGKCNWVEKMYCMWLFLLQWLPFC